jgi:tetratricopeptide (TPR) repeat protein
VADIFVSYTSSDRDWAFWIGQELEKLGHVAHLHDWEISAGGNIMAWMEERHNEADLVLCVVSGHYLQQPYSALERQGAQWAAVSNRPNFLLPVFIESCEAPNLLALLKRCDLHGLTEEQARERLAADLKPAAKPTGPVPFPGVGKTPAGEGTPLPSVPVVFPGKALAISNIPIAVPRYFLGRDRDLAAIDTALKGTNGRAAITTALHGLRGVGKTTLAAAYAERRRADYHATWWIRAETESTMRADLVGLGVQLGWIVTDEKEEPALAAVMRRLRDEGDGILLIYDNANNSSEIRPYTPRSGAARVIVTSTAPDWGGVATLVELEVWSKEIGADYLTERTGRFVERDAALALSEALGGLPLAHEQAAAYCARVGLSLADYLKRFEANPAKLPGTQKDAPHDYGRTVATTFALAIDEAAKLHSAAEPLIVSCALLAPEPIPLFLFSQAREKFGEPLSSALADDGLDEAVAALRAVALIDRESIPDERDPTITTDCIRLHRLVRQVAAARFKDEVLEEARLKLIEALATAYPVGVLNDPPCWPLARRLDALALALVSGQSKVPRGAEKSASYLLNQLAGYRQGPLAAYAMVRPLLERGLALVERSLGSDHLDTAGYLNNLGYASWAQNDFVGARLYHERALAIRERVLGPGHPDTAVNLNNLGTLLQSVGDLAGARPHYERALTICEGALGPDHPDTATSLNNLGYLLRAQGDLVGARPHYERALAIRERVLGPDHPDTATSLNNLGYLLRAQGDLAAALPYYERALAIRERVFGPDHPDMAISLNNLGSILKEQGDLAGARLCCERALAIYERAAGPEHLDTALSLNNLGVLLRYQGDLVSARPYLERALAIYEKTLGPTHPDTQETARSYAVLLHELDIGDQAAKLRAKYDISDQ